METVSFPSSDVANAASEVVNGQSGIGESENGEEEFVEAPDNPIEGEDDGSSPSVHSLEFYTPRSVAPATKPPNEDDNHDDGAGDGSGPGEQGYGKAALVRESLGDGNTGLKIIGVLGSSENPELERADIGKKDAPGEVGLAQTANLGQQDGGGAEERDGELEERDEVDKVVETQEVAVDESRDSEKPELEGNEGKSGEDVEGQTSEALQAQELASAIEGRDDSDVVGDSSTVDVRTDQPHGSGMEEGGTEVVEEAPVLAFAVQTNDGEVVKDAEVVDDETDHIDGSVMEQVETRLIEDAPELASAMATGDDSDSVKESKTDQVDGSAVETVEANVVEADDEKLTSAGAGDDSDSVKDSKIDQVDGSAVETVEADVVEADGEKLASAGDSHSDAMQSALDNAEGDAVANTEHRADSEEKQNEPGFVVQSMSSAREDQSEEDEIQAEDFAALISHIKESYELESVENDLPKKPENGVSVQSLSSGISEQKPLSEVEAIKDEDEDRPYLEEGSGTDEDTEGLVLGNSEAAKQLLEELERGSGSGSHSGAESSRAHSQRIDGQTATDSDEEADTDEEGDGKELFDSAALAALLKAATGANSDGGSITITSQDGSRLFSVERPAGLGSSLRSVKPAPRTSRPNIFSSNVTSGGDSANNLSEEEKKKLEKLQQIRVKFLRLVQRLDHSSEDSIVEQVLYRLALIGGRQTGQLFSLENAKRMASQLEAERTDDLDFSLNILVLGKTGVGKSATINSIFGEEKTQIHAFEPATTAVREIVGTVDGVKIKVFDTPGLKTSVMEQGVNRRILSSIKKFIKKCPPDIVLYVDRLDAQTRDLNDLPLLRCISSCLGSSVWRNAIVTLTHGASAPPDAPSGSPLSYEVFVAQRSHVVQQSIGQAVGDLRLMNPSLMNPVALVENHAACRKNRDGQKILPNGQIWRHQLLLFCYSMKILSEASSISKPQDPFDHRKLFGFRVRSPPLPYLLSWLLQSRAHPKLSTDQGVDNGDSDIDLADLSDSDQEEEEDEYDQLPPFKPLRKAQIAKLSKEQRKAYFEEYDYRVKLLQKKQWKEELKRMRDIKKKGKADVDEPSYFGEDADPENAAPAAVPVPLPDMVLPPSFDGENPAYRYRFLEPNSQFLARPVLDTHGWDHDCGYDGVNIEHSLAVVNRFPTAVTIQLTKDKKEFNLHLDSSVSAKHGENGSSMAGFDIQNIGKQLAYIVRGETKFKNFKRNKTAAGFSVTFLGENIATGFKVEDQIALGKRLMLVGSTGTVRSQGDLAYGANLEVRFREADFPIGQDQSSLGLSLVKWRGDLALGANLQSQFSVGRNSKLALRAGLNNKRSGQITIRTSSSDHIQIALVGILPVAMAIYKSIWPGVRENYSLY